MADLDVAENLCAGPDQHATPDFRMPVARLFARASQSDALENRNVVFDDGRLANDQPGRMVEKDALPIRAAGLMSTANTDEERLCR